MSQGPFELFLTLIRDGRFRVNEFVCRDNTWRETVRKLFAGAEAVLVDLRGFAPERTDAGREEMR